MVKKETKEKGNGASRKQCTTEHLYLNRICNKSFEYKEVITLGRRNWKQSNLPLLLLLIYFSPLTLSSTSFGRFVMSFFCSLNINPLYHPRFKEPDNDPHPLHPPTTLRSINMKLVV